MGWAKQRCLRPTCDFFVEEDESLEELSPTVLAAPFRKTLSEWSPKSVPFMLSSQASCVIVSGFRAALELDTYPLSNLIRPRCAERAKRGRGKPVLIMHIDFFACFHAISLERSRFSKFATLFFMPL